MLGIDYCNDCEYQEVLIDGPFLDLLRAKAMLIKAGKGSVLYFYCIKALNAAGELKILKEMTLHL